ncbi:hypothetical protein BVRB_8g184390 [Beta vulgaris subsp. vulgaris]|nr:hypothetical protein BVRB_8g184390 [Beta vulgaris subsp. vulgaris]
MTKFCGYHNHNIFVMLLVALILASMILNSQCRLIVSQLPGEEDDLGMKWALEMSSRDEIVQLAGYGEEKLSTVLITGGVVCNKACLATKHSSNHHQLQLSPQPISGALVGVACHTKKDKSTHWVKAVTDNFGDFTIDLPSHLHGIPDLDKACSVKILDLPKDSSCHQSASASKHKEIKLASTRNGKRTYMVRGLALQHTLPENSAACMKKQKDEQ